MKCPKCAYLGFDTGDRCKNCGYDFSLMAAPAAPDPDLPLHAGEPEMLPPDLALPLFDSRGAEDAPLVTLPPAPRPPLAVRRTPEPPRARTVSRVSRTEEREGAGFHPGGEPEHTSLEDWFAVQVPRADEPVAARPQGIREVGGRRFVAAAIDHALLLTIDAGVVYFTLRMAGLTAADAWTLPLAPLLTFIALLKFSYFAAFTAAGGQTIGKMAMSIRVVGDPDPVDSGRALRRTLAGVLSLLTLGAGLLPAFFGSDRRTLHDRLTRTRVIGLPSA